jgi:hypothetical protein
VRSAIVGGALATKSGNGGNAWTRLNLVLGLRRLGFDVCLVEQLAATPEQAAYFEGVCGAFGVSGYLVDGAPPPELVERAEDADLLLDVGGHLTVKPLRSAPRIKVFLDDDPGYTQFWHAQGLLGDRLDGHDFYFTFGENLGRPGCSVPTNGIDWRPTRPAVVLEEWPVVAAADRDRFTTIASWRGAYGRVEHDGHVYGQKAHEFRKLAELPRRVPQTLEIALEIAPADAADAKLLRERGWRLVDPLLHTGEPDDFRRYVQGSAAELSPAQGIYVETGSGWFSDRTAAYLASGKPAVVQETGFSRTIPAGEGLLAFRTPADAATAVERIARDYDAHAEAARELAETWFDSDVVLGRLLDEVGL